MKAEILETYNQQTAFLDKLCRFYHFNVFKDSTVSDYLQNTRRLSVDTINKFKIGYSPSSDLVFKFLEMNHLDSEFLYSTGTFIRKGDTRFDLFHERITFPILDVQGKVIAFSGRTLNDSNSCKYINNTASLIFSKGLSLFNINYAYSEIIRLGYAIVVEGIVDAISLMQSGITNVVAPCGTALTKEHLYLLRYMTSKLVLMFDSDSAGNSAFIRAETACKSLNFQYRQFPLPGVKDPDDYIKNYGIYPMLQGLNSITFT